MDVTPDRSRLGYVDADDLDNTTIAFDELKVRNPAGETLGEVDGAIVDIDSGRPYYIVVDAGGWFHSKRYLVPIGHIRLDEDNDSLLVDLSRERINRFPGFDRDEFRKLDARDLERMETQIAECCCPGEAVNTGAATAGERWSHHRVPDWWDANNYRPDRSGRRNAATAPVAPGGDQRPHVRDTAETLRPDRGRVGEAEAVVAREGGETSPHVGGRAEPGDVIGVETGGERTYLGDTAKDENERRREAEKGAGKQAEDDLKRRHD